MLEILKFVFTDFWHFIGFLILFWVVMGHLYYIVQNAVWAYQLRLRNKNIESQGWPPLYLDADGEYQDWDDPDDDGGDDDDDDDSPTDEWPPEWHQAPEEPVSNND